MVERRGGGKTRSTHHTQRRADGARRQVDAELCADDAGVAVRLGDAAPDDANLKEEGGGG